MSAIQNIFRLYASEYLHLYGSNKAQQWLINQLQNLLPCSYFLITFTVPDELRAFIRRNQQAAYSAMFSAASSAALKTLAGDKRFIGAEKTGFTGVLHTWGRQLQYHPHIHFIVPGGGLSEDRNKWLPSKPDFFVRVEPLSIIYRAKFRDAMLPFPMHVLSVVTIIR